MPVSFVDFLFKAGMWVAIIGWGVWLFAKFFLGEDVDNRVDDVVHLTYACFGVMIFATLVKYTGRLRMKHSKKKCLRCAKPAAMGSIYCEFHKRQAAREMGVALDTLPEQGEDEDEKLGY